MWWAWPGAWRPKASPSGPCAWTAAISGSTPGGRRILDDGQLPGVTIFASGNLDEFRIRDLLASGAAESLARFRERIRDQVRRLPAAQRRLEGAPAYPVTVSESVRQLESSADRGR